MRKARVLWIEDSARLELRNLVGPVYFSGKYDFNLAEDVTSAVNLLQAGKFDAVLVDIRLPPGMDATWRKHYRQTSSDKVRAQLGLKLLSWLLQIDPLIYPGAVPPAWIKPHHLGVFSVESPREVEKELKTLGISVYRQKSAGLPDTVLVELFDQLLAQTRSVN
jgi:CheY-like chemotaxis protein